jgi:serine/threonine protein kinase/WD40 repeat protein
MDPGRYNQLKKLIDQALELPEIQRDSFLQQNCPDSEQLSEARNLLFHHRPDLDATEITLGKTMPFPDLTGKKIGPYEILQHIGEGGMGVVYLAAQSAPLRRKVALKVIKVGMDTREVINRFESERQALALMDHPNIAKVFDAGATEQGRPFFVMEYIPGVPLIEYCNDHQLGLRQRLNLFIQICKGVEHAHQKGIIHRDLKPGNILVNEVEGKAVPKIIDFGVAKATVQHLAAQTIFTRIGQVIGTPEYMSPEQAGSTTDDVDTRSDVYSLGVLLYELLTGVVPLERQDILRAGLDRMALHVQQEVPKKPSTRIVFEATQPRGVTTLHGRDTHLWVKRIRGDLDWITMKALEKDRDRRYGSAVGLATDVERHLQCRVVSAGPPSRLYRTKKFVQRNRAGVGLTAILLVALVGFSAWQTVQARIISQERDKAMANERLSHARGQITKDPTMAVAYALASLEILDQPNARDVIRQAISFAPLRNELPRWGQTGNPITVDASPNGRDCVVAWSRSENPTVGIYNLTDYSMRVFKAPNNGIAYDVIFNSDGTHVVSDGDNGINIWRVADGQHLHNLTLLHEYDSISLFKLEDPRMVAVAASQMGERTQWFELDISEGSFRKLGQSRGSHFVPDFHLPAINSAATRILDYEKNTIFLQKFDDLDTERATLVGKHDASITSVAFDETTETGVSADVEGVIKVWDLVTDPPKLIRFFKKRQGIYRLKFDPHGLRFFSSWGSGTINVYDLSETPKQNPLQMLDRTHWAHDGAFFPDKSLVTVRNAIKSGAVAHWKTNTPVAWSLDFGGDSQVQSWVSLSNDGRAMYLWSGDGIVSGVPLVDGKVEWMGHLGKTRGWQYGVHSKFIVDVERNRCLTSCDGLEILDFNTGLAQGIPGISKGLYLRTLSQSGRYAGYHDMNNRENFVIFDIDSMNVVARLDLFGLQYDDFSFSGDNHLLALGDDHLAKFNFMNSSVPPDTLWRGDASGGGAVLGQGDFLLVRDGDMNVFWNDLSGDRELKLGKTPIGDLNSVDFQEGLGLVALGGWFGTIEVFHIENGGHWKLPGPNEERKATYNLSFDPLGRWLISRHPAHVIAWNLPLDPLYGELEHAVLLESLRSKTNVRVVVDETQPNGFRITNTLELEDERRMN